MNKYVVLSLVCFFSTLFYGVASANNSSYVSAIEVKTEVVPSANLPAEKGDRAADFKVTQDVQNVLFNDRTLPADAKNIKVTTDNGTVVLQGSVANKDDATAIVKKVEAVKGVKKVDNKLDIRGTK